MFLKLVLQGLAADWKVEKELLVANLASSPAERTDHLEPSATNASHNSEEDIHAQGADRRIPFPRTPSPCLSPDLCYVSADSLSSVGECI